jgi:hypothetical protein
MSAECGRKTVDFMLKRENLEAAAKIHERHDW